MEELTERERRLVGFAIFSASMKLGPSVFYLIDQIIDKIGVRKEFEHCAEDWLKTAEGKKNPQ